jgi:anti-sigma B factor antagonist
MRHDTQTSVRRIELDGEYDISRRDEVSSAFEAMRGDAPAVVDMTKVSFVDSSFLHALTALHFRFEEWGVTLVGVRPQIRRVLKMMDYERLFHIAES